MSLPMSSVFCILLQANQWIIIHGSLKTCVSCTPLVSYDRYKCFFLSFKRHENQKINRDVAFIF